MWVDLSDGRILAVPLAWFPCLLHATPEQRLKLEISQSGLHWDDLDEDISIAGLLAGIGDVTRPEKHAACRGSQAKSSRKPVSIGDLRDIPL
jgi:hypothetical protein